MPPAICALDVTAAFRPLCAAKYATRSSTSAVVNLSDYTYNDDGTLCERVTMIGGPLDGMEFPFHTYVDPAGRWVFVTTQDIAYSCPDAATNLLQLNSQGPGFKIGKSGDDPPRSGELPCTNP